MHAPCFCHCLAVVSNSLDVAFDLRAMFFRNDIFAHKTDFLCVTELDGNTIPQTFIGLFDPSFQCDPLTHTASPSQLVDFLERSEQLLWTVVWLLDPPQMVTKVRVRCKTNCIEGIIVFQVCSCKNMREVGDIETCRIYIIKLSMIWNSWCCSRLLS